MSYHYPITILFSKNTKLIEGIPIPLILLKFENDVEQTCHAPNPKGSKA